MKKVIVIIALLSLSTVSAQRLARLPDHFHVIGKEKNSSLFDPSKKQHEIIFVLIPAAAESAKKDPHAAEMLKKFTNNNTLKVPYSFFSVNHPAKTTYPLCVYFDWQDSSPSTNQLSTPAHELAKGIDYLHSLNSTCIAVSQGRGGLVLNAATHKLKKPLKTVIQLGTPIPTDTKKYAAYMPNPDKIEQHYTFYSEHPFTYSKPTLHPKYSCKYNSSTQLNDYSVLLLINNKQPAQQQLYAHLVGKNVLSLCHEIKKHFKYNRDLFASLSPLKKETNLLVAIKNPIKATNSSVLEEQSFSNAQKKNFTLAWKRAPELNLSTGARIRSLYRYKKA